MNIDSLKIIELVTKRDTRFKSYPIKLLNDVSVMTNTISVEYVRQNILTPFNFSIVLTSTPNKYQDLQKMLGTILEYDNTIIRLDEVYICNFKIKDVKSSIISNKQQLYKLQLDISIYRKEV